MTNIPNYCCCCENKNYISKLSVEGLQKFILNFPFLSKNCILDGMNPQRQSRFLRLSLYKEKGEMYKQVCKDLIWYHHPNYGHRITINNYLQGIITDELIEYRSQRICKFNKPHGEVNENMSDLLKELEIRSLNLEAKNLFGGNTVKYVYKYVNKTPTMTSLENLSIFYFFLLNQIRDLLYYFRDLNPLQLGIKVDKFFKHYRNLNNFYNSL